MCLCSGVLKRLEEEDLDDNVKKRLKDSSETPGALWHVYASKDVEKVKEFLHKVTAFSSFSQCIASRVQRSLSLTCSRCLVISLSCAVLVDVLIKPYIPPKGSFIGYI